MNYCVVGDVHGEYKALLNLVAKTPMHSKLVFVGDLIDRGSESAHVVRFVRKHELPCVQGNHEFMMIEYGTEFIENVKNNREIEQDNVWLKHGGRETLLSYGLISIQRNEIVLHPFIEEFIFQFEDDIEWMKSLPLYLELDTTHSSNRKVVVSHSAIAPVWKMKESNDIEDMRKFNNIVLWGRVKPVDTEPIFNIFGHTPQQYSADMKKHYVNIDTGCYMKTDKGYGLLSAYCVETEEIYSSSDLSYEKAS
jgi:serine/threonine protein phosphatase 1